MTNDDQIFDFTVQKKALGLFWLWKVTRDGDIISVGLAFSEAAAQSQASETADHYRKQAWNQQYE